MGSWTPNNVEIRLIEAFWALPGRPCLSSGGRLVEGHAPAVAVTAFGWVDRWIGDSAERKALLTWARCRASGESWSEQCRSLGWAKRTAEERRARTAERIAGSLNQGGS